MRCGCGEITGQQCAADVGREGIIVEAMPEHLRSSHEAAGYSGLKGCGSYPGNGAVRLWCAPACAEGFDGDEWVRVLPLSLATLTPEAVGLDAAERVCRRLARLAAPLSPGVVVARAEPEETGLRWTVEGLATFAQSGRVGDWGSPAGAEDALLECGEALWSRPVDEGDDDGWAPADLRAALAADAEPTDHLRLAVGCALARWAIWRGERVTVGELAALASVSPSLVRNLIAAGEIAATVEPAGRTRAAYVEAAEAHHWLAARGVRGWR